MTERELYAEPRVVTDLQDCDFYHTMDIPGHGHVDGQFDLRGLESSYLGGVPLAGKRVLEVGPANGFFSFHMAGQGAEVVSVELSEKQVWDIVPYASVDREAFAQRLSQGIRRINNGYWLCHRAFESNAKVIYTSVYDLPEAIGAVDLATFCAVLVHFQNPFLALHNVLRHVKDTVVITEMLGQRTFFAHLFNRFNRPFMTFLPNGAKARNWDVEAAMNHLDECLSWWALPPSIVREYLSVLGFGDAETTFHHPKYMGKKLRAYTIVAKRTTPMR